MAKILRVNLSDLKANIEDLPNGYEGLGGRALTSTIVSKEVPPLADPLGVEMFSMFQKMRSMAYINLHILPIS
jgi:aldehyde:ferredoxin oxidoreductase